MYENQQDLTSDDLILKGLTYDDLIREINEIRSGNLGQAQNLVDLVFQLRTESFKQEMDLKYLETLQFIDSVSDFETLFTSTIEQADNFVKLISELDQGKFYQLVMSCFGEIQKSKSNEAAVSPWENHWTTIFYLLVVCRGRKSLLDIEQAYSSSSNDKYTNIIVGDAIELAKKAFLLFPLAQYSAMDDKTGKRVMKVEENVLDSPSLLKPKKTLKDFGVSGEEATYTGLLAEQDFVGFAFDQVCEAGKSLQKRNNFLQALDKTLQGSDMELFLELLQSGLACMIRNYNDKTADQEQQQFLMQILSVIIKQFKIVDAFQPYFIELDVKRDENKETFRNYLCQKATVNVNSGNFKNRFTFLTGVLKTIVMAEKEVLSNESVTLETFNTRFRDNLNAVIHNYNKERSIKSQMGTRLKIYQPAINDVLDFEARISAKVQQEILNKKQGESDIEYCGRVLLHVTYLLNVIKSPETSKLQKLWNLRPLMRHLNRLCSKLPDADKKQDLLVATEKYSILGTMIFFDKRVEVLLVNMQSLLSAQVKAPVDTDDAMPTCSNDNVHLFEAGAEYPEDGMPSSVASEGEETVNSYKRVKSWGSFSSESRKVREEPKRRYSFSEFGKIAKATFFGLAVSVASVNVAAADEKERNLNDSDRTTETVLRNVDDDTQRFRSR